jgi:hypothetical protein
MLENRKKRIKTSSTTPNKMITNVSLPQEGDTGETISKTTIDVSKHVIASNVVSKTIKLYIEENQNLRDVDKNQTLEVEVLEEEVVEY